MLNYISYFNARRLEKNKQWKPALEAYKKIVKDKDVIPAKISYRLGFVAEKLQDWKTAETWLSKAVKLESDKAQWIYRLALSQEKNKKYAVAIDNYKKAINLEPQKASWMYRCGLCLEHLKKYSEAQSLYEQSLKFAPNAAECQYRLGKIFSLSGRRAIAEVPLRKAMELDPQNASYAYELAVAIRKQGRTWQEVEALEHAISLDVEKAQWNFELGEAQDKMNRVMEAALAFQRANQLNPGNAVWHYREGYALEQTHDFSKASIAYTAAKYCDRELKAQQFGIGVFHQSRGLWPQAAAAYELELMREPFNGELAFRLGMAHDRCYEWVKAAECYRQALAFTVHKSEWHYRLGFVLERQGLFYEAAEAYDYAARTTSSHAPYWFYRLGFSLTAVGNYEMACDAFLHMHPEHFIVEKNTEKQDDFHGESELCESYVEGMKCNLRAFLESPDIFRTQDAATAFHRLATQAQRLMMWEEASKAYKRAVDRSNSHHADWYYCLGHALFQLGDFKKAAKVFCESKIHQAAHGIDSSRYENDVNLIRIFEYRSFVEHLPVIENSILYESYSGVSMGCNPLAIYKLIRNDPTYSNWRHIWVINDNSNISDEFDIDENLILVKRDSQLYLRYLATAKYLINNSTFPTYFSRREGQYYLNTWHGTPLKSLGKDINGSLMEHKNSARNFLQATHLLSPNSHTSEILLSRNDVAGLFSGELAELGYPRNDRLSLVNIDANNNLKRKLGLNDFNKKVVLYAPTWRGTLEDPVVDYSKLIADIERLQQADCYIIFRGHYFSEQALGEKVSGNIFIAPQAIDTSELLAITDILVTDYSSIFFDYLITGRPIYFYCYDLLEYEEDRGLYFDIRELPGALCQTIDDLLKKLSIMISDIEDGSWQVDLNYARAKDKFCLNDDGYSANKVVEWFFEKKTEYSKEIEVSKRSVLINIGDLAVNGITTAGVNLVKELSKKLVVTVVVDVGDECIGGRKHEIVKSLSEHAYILARSGRQSFSLEEKWINEKFFQLNVLSENQLKVFKKSFEFEYRRMFGHSKIDFVINYDGYTRFWVAIFALGVMPATRNFIWQHNNMLEERNKKYPFLDGVFYLYEKYRKIVSVSESVCRENIDNLQPLLKVSQDKFTCIENFLDVDLIKIKSGQALDVDICEWLEGWNGFLFVNVGRLSVEKNQKRLISAFARLPQKRYSKLALMGEGVLKEELVTLINSLSLQDSVKIFPARTNPFPFISRADCFVLSSDHEGQGLVLLEAMALNIPVISTDIPGPQSVLKDSPSSLVYPDIQSLSDKMSQAYDGELDQAKFEFDKYKSDIDIKLNNTLLCNLI